MARRVCSLEVSDIMQILSSIESGDAQAASELLPLVYTELRRLAAAHMAHEKPGQTLQATGLVHEAYLRLVGTDHAQRWNSRGHFFAAAAEAMRRILIEQARSKQSQKAEQRGRAASYPRTIGSTCRSMMRFWIWITRSRSSAGSIRTPPRSSSSGSSRV